MLLQATLYLFYYLFFVSKHHFSTVKLLENRSSFLFWPFLHPSTHTGSIPMYTGPYLLEQGVFFFFKYWKDDGSSDPQSRFCLLNGRVYSRILGLSQQLITVHIHMGISTILYFWCQTARLCKKETFWILTMQLWKTQEYLWKDEHNLPLHSHLTSGFSFMTGKYFYIPNNRWHQIPLSSPCLTWMSSQTVIVMGLEGPYRPGACAGFHSTDSSTLIWFGNSNNKNFIFILRLLLVFFALFFSMEFYMEIPGVFISSPSNFS